MEHKLYTDDFEQFLKETADDFRMYPSKRVWNSLYNNLHPGRKWPSLAVCLLLVSSIIFIGLSHKNEITGSSHIVKTGAAATGLIAFMDQNGFNLKETLPTTNSNKNIQVQAITNAPIDFISIAVKQDDQRSNPIIRNYPASGNLTHSNKNNLKETDSNEGFSAGTKNKVVRSLKNSTAVRLTVASPEESEVITENKTDDNKFGKDNSPVTQALHQQTVELNLAERKLPSISIPLLSTIKSKKNVDKEWIEDYAFHNQPGPALKSKLVYELFITPSIGYRALQQTASYKPTASRSSFANAVPDGRPGLKHSPAFNLEAGYSVKYSFSKSFRIKGGLQFNYTNYKGTAHELGHTTTANLALKDPYTSNGVVLSQRSTSLANLYGNENEKKLNNSTFQVSLPLGADLKIAGKQRNIQWFVGATIQPTYVLFGNAYLISADFKNYILDSKMLRKWNLNGGLEAFVSYKTKKGITFNAGPQFRVQFLSTYKDKYSFDEKLYNVGIKFGMTKNF